MRAYIKLRRHLYLLEITDSKVIDKLFKSTSTNIFYMNLLWIFNTEEDFYGMP